MVADAEGRHGRALASILSTCRRGENLTQGNLDPCDILRCQRLEVCADETSEECGTDVVGMTFWDSY